MESSSDPSTAPESPPAAQPDPQQEPRPGWFRRLYDQLLLWAETPQGVWVLVAVAFVESSFFPIPPDVFLIALALARPARWVWLALYTTVASVLGGMAGYAIGWGLWASVKDHVIPRVFSQANFDQVSDLYTEHGLAIVFLAAFTPIPYKVFTICAGISKLNLLGFAAASFIGRGARFGLVAWIVHRFGPKAREIIERHFAIATIVGGALAVGGYYALKALKH